MAKRTGIIIALILAGESIFFLPFILARIFRPTILEVFDISNLELGFCFSIYGIVAMISYVFGGPLADRFPSRKLMAISLWLTAAGGLYYCTIPSLGELKIIYGFWGFSTIFLFWAAMLKATRLWGGEHYQGRAFGWLEGGRGLSAALLGTLAVSLFGMVMPESSEMINESARNTSFVNVILVTSLITALVGFIVWFTLPQEQASNANSTGWFFPSLVDSGKSLNVWLMSIVVICAYVGYKITDDYSLYAHEVLGFSEVDAAAFGGTAMWLRPVFAIAAGLLADRISASKVLTYCFAGSATGGLLVYMNVLSFSALLVILLLASTLAGIYGIRGVYFAVLQEAKIPVGSTGTTIGLISLLGFTPDIFMSPLMGYLLDNFPGIQGHQYVFLVLFAFSVVGLGVAVIFKRRLNSLD